MPIERVRSIFLAASLVSVALLAGLLTGMAMTGRPLAALALPPLALLAAKWVAEFRGLHPRLPLDLLEAVSVMAVGVATGNPLTILLLLYLRTSLRALDAPGRRLAVMTVAWIAAFLGAVLSGWSTLGPVQVVAYLLLGLGIPVAATVMQALGRTLVQLRQATERERALREAEYDAHFRRLFEASPQPMWLYDELTLQFLAVNEAAVAHYGYSHEQFLAMSVVDLDAAETARSAEPAAPQHADCPSQAGDRRHRLRDGRVIDVEIVCSRLLFHERPAVLVLARDVTEQRELHRRLEHQAFHDALTGLPNRAQLDEQVRRRLGRRGSAGSQPAMLVFDLDGFKAINDTLGHGFGDQVIAEVGARLRAALRRGDVASRLGGDEFAVLLGRAAGSDEAIAVARGIIAAIQQPLVVDGRTVAVSASVGIAFPRPEHRGVEDFIADADVAMYVAKTRGTGTCVLFEPRYRDDLVDRITLQEDLGQALARGQLSVHYQPQLDLRSGRVVGTEALVRWQHPMRGMVPPDVFVPLAEQLGLISAIDEMVLQTACRQLRRWCDETGRSMRVAVNLSGRDFENGDFATMVRTTLVECMLDPWQLELELTESAAVSQPEAAVARLQELRAVGVRIAIDDFGTGYSMLTRLRRLPADRLKIDRSFVLDIAGDDDARTIVRSTIAMGHALGLDLVAEGVESEAATAVLRELGCDYAQGYHFSRPLPAEQLSEWLLERAGREEAPAVAVG